MSRTAFRGLFCLAVCLVLTTSAMAQQGRGRGGFGGFGGGGGNYVFLLADEKVPDELKLTADQKTKVTALREEIMAAGFGGAGRGNFQNMSEEERAKFIADQQKRTEDNNKKVEALLNADQIKRLKELSLQQRMQFGGYGALLADPAIVKEIKLTSAQEASVKTIQEESAKQMREVFQGGGGFSPETQAKVAEMRKAADEEYLAVLNAEQKSQITKMTGAKFEFSPPQFGRGRRGN